MNVQSFAHLSPTTMPDVLFTVAVISVSVAVSLVTLAHCVPDLYREVKTWFAPAPAKVIDLETRRRQPRAIAVSGDSTRVSR